jgi:hypothetical protein
MSPSTRSALERIAESDRDKDDGAFRSCYEMGVCETARLHPCEYRAHLRAPCGLPRAIGIVIAMDEPYLRAPRLDRCH